ncbi:hypothetical protein YPPY71_2194, partial [Yersinia pestis PY-71]
MRLPYR